MLEFIKLQFWFTIANTIHLPVNQAEHHIKDIYNRVKDKNKETPELSIKFQNALEFYIKAKNIIPDL